MENNDKANPKNYKREKLAVMTKYGVINRFVVTKYGMTNRFVATKYGVTNLLS